MKCLNKGVLLIKDNFYYIASLPSEIPFENIERRYPVFTLSTCSQFRVEALRNSQVSGQGLGHFSRVPLTEQSIFLVSSSRGSRAKVLLIKIYVNRKLIIFSCQMFFKWPRLARSNYCWAMLFKLAMILRIQFNYLVSAE